MPRGLDRAVKTAQKNPWLRVHIVPSGDRYFLAIRRRDGSSALVLTTDNHWCRPASSKSAPICMFDTEKDARDTAEAVVHVPDDYESVLDVLGPEEEGGDDATHDQRTRS